MIAVDFSEAFTNPKNCGLLEAYEKLDLPSTTNDAFPVCIRRLCSGHADLD